MAADALDHNPTPAARPDPRPDHPPDAPPRSESPADGLETRDPQQWIDLHGVALYRYARARLDSDEAAEDAVQDCLLAAIERVDAFEGQSSVRTWLIGILKHKVYDTIRARYRDAERRERLLRDLHGGSPSPDTPDSTDETPHHSGPETEELRDSIARGVRALPPVMRDAIRLKDIDGLSTETVCEMLGITATNLWTILHRAKQRLREDLTPGE